MSYNISIDGPFHLTSRPVSERLNESLLDLILIHLETSGLSELDYDSLILEKLHYVSGERCDGKSCMRFDLHIKPAKAAKHDGALLTLEFIVETGTQINADRKR